MKKIIKAGDLSFKVLVLILMLALAGPSIAKDLSRKQQQEEKECEAKKECQTEGKKKKSFLPTELSTKVTLFLLYLAEQAKGKVK